MARINPASSDLREAAEVAAPPATASQITARITGTALTALKEDGRLLCAAATFALAAVIVYRLVLYFDVTR